MRSWHLAHVAMCAPLSGSGSTSILLRVGYWGCATIAASALLETTCFFENKELKNRSCESAALWSRHATLLHLLHEQKAFLKLRRDYQANFRKLKVVHRLSYSKAAVARHSDICTYEDLKIVESALASHLESSPDGRVHSLNCISACE